MRKDQELLQDDFEEACKTDGIEIKEVEPKETEDEGKGSTLWLRTTAPSYDNPWYLKRGMGGYNNCILISGNSCLANCVGYAHGAFLEEVGVTTDYRAPTCNARDFIKVAQRNGLPTGNEPRLGAIIVWWSDLYGHVGIVVGIDGDTITVAQSNYGGTRFFLTVHRKPYNISGQTCIGFVYNPYLQGGWKKDGTGWWYDYGDGTYPYNKWELINNKWYHFDGNGYMQTGWIQLNGKYYYLNDDGAMQTGWIYLKPHWYYTNADGVMQTGWKHIDGKWYFFAGSGDMRTGWLKDKGNWYYLDTDGHMVTGEKTVPCKFNEKGELTNV